jgi:hypothetical protein
MGQFFICNENEVNLKLKSFIKTETSADGWTIYYIDKNTNEKWLQTRYKSEMQGGGVSVLKRLPEPTIEDLIEIAMTSFDRNDIVGASLELSQRERRQKEDFRDKLISRLIQVDTAGLSNFEKERMKLIIYESNLYDATNRRDIVGKHFTEIQNDADYYQKISQKAKRILVDIEK